MKTTQIRRWGDEELGFLSEMVEQESLFYWNGPQTKAFVERFRVTYPFKHIMPCSSGTASLHIASACARFEPGDEVIVPAVTDMGTVIGLLYQMVVPVFADIDAHTHNLDPLDVKRKITRKTRGVIVVHLAGNPCDMDAFVALAEEHSLVLIEDCAQAWGAKWKGKPVGTMGHFGCFSLNDFKHISCGEGGVVGTSNDEFGSLLQKYGDKGYDRITGSRAPDFLAPNYRISEPQSAVARAQMEKMDFIASRRNFLGTLLCDSLGNLRNMTTHRVLDGAYCSWWFYLLVIEDGKREAVASRLQSKGIDVSVGFLSAPLYKYPVFQNHNFFQGHWPVKALGLTDMDYRNVICPVAEKLLETCINIKISEWMDEDYIETLSATLKEM